MTISATDLGTYLGVDAIVEDRADKLILLASDLAAAAIGTTVDDLPDAAAAVILSAAGRAYVNPTGVTAQLAGPYQMSGATGGVYLTKAERAALGRLAGRAGAFSINMLPAAYREDPSS